MTEKLLVNVTEAARQLSLSREMVYRELRCGRLPVVRVGRATRIPTEALRQWTMDRMESWDREPWPFEMK
ncbi:MAG: helix-turn-helix domain-containing protein [Chloroflexi bacterium]|nr:helix-turn-helix domain-containing protein [Chloroflexota bacterium]